VYIAPGDRDVYAYYRFNRVEDDTERQPSATPSSSTDTGQSQCTFYPEQISCSD